MERWKTVDEFPKYSISDRGRVKNSVTDHVMTLCPNTKGYPKVRFFEDGKQHSRTVHKLVAEAFIPNPENKETVNHEDDNKWNNNVSNLSWNTNLENMQHAVAHGLVVRSDNAGRPKRPVTILETNDTYDSIHDCAKAISGDFRSVHGVVSGRRKTYKGLHFKYSTKEE